MKNIVGIFLIIMSVVIGCSPQKKLNRLIKRHPELLQADTIFFSDTIIRGGIRVDTFLSIKFDSFKIEKGNLSIDIKIIHDTLYLEAEVKEDTSIVEHEIPYKPVIVKELTFWEKHGIFIWILILLLLIIIILYLARGFIKPQKSIIG